MSKGLEEEESEGQFFVLRADKVEDGEWLLVFRTEKIEDEGGSSFFGPGISKNPLSLKNPLSSSKKSHPPLPFFRTIFDLFFEAEDRRWENIIRSLGRKSKIEDGEF